MKQVWEVYRETCLEFILTTQNTEGKKNKPLKLNEIESKSSARLFASLIMLKIRQISNRKVKCKPAKQLAKRRLRDKIRSSFYVLLF